MSLDKEWLNFDGMPDQDALTGATQGKLARWVWSDGELRDRPTFASTTLRTRSTTAPPCSGHSLLPVEPRSGARDFTTTSSGCSSARLYGLRVPFDIGRSSAVPSR
jgi:hypothetical protein